MVDNVLVLAWLIIVISVVIVANELSCVLTDTRSLWVRDARVITRVVLELPRAVATIRGRRGQR